MSKPKLYMFAGLTWMLCCVYQLKNGNTFMIGFSAIIAALLFGLAIYNKFKSKRHEKDN